MDQDHYCRDDEDEQYFMREGFEDTDLFQIITMVVSCKKLFELLSEPTATLPNLILTNLNMPGKTVRFIKGNWFGCPASPSGYYHIYFFGQKYDGKVPGVGSNRLPGKVRNLQRVLALCQKTVSTGAG